MITVLEVLPSNRKDKRLMALLSNGRKIHFGLKNGATYLDHKDDNKRLAYIARHYANEKEKYLIDNLILSPSVLSLFLLWGYYDDIDENIKFLNKDLLKQK